MLDAYITRPSGKPKGGIVFIHDIFGYQGGRLFHMADDFAAQGYLVVCPDLFDLNGVPMPTLREAEHLVWPPWRIVTGTSQFMERLSRPWEITQEKIFQVAKYLRAESGLPDIKLGAIGCCWGGWAITRASSIPNGPFVCAAGWHPSPDAQRLQRAGPSTVEILKAVKIPLLLAPAWQDPSYMRPDGWWTLYLNGAGRPSIGSESHYFPEMNHGWTTRGDLRVPTIKRDVDVCFAKTLNFFNRHLANQPQSKI